MSSWGGIIQICLFFPMPSFFLMNWTNLDCYVLKGNEASIAQMSELRAFQKVLKIACFGIKLAQNIKVSFWLFPRPLARSNTHSTSAWGRPLRFPIAPSWAFCLHLAGSAGHMEAIHNHTWSSLALHCSASQSLIPGWLIGCYQQPWSRLTAKARPLNEGWRCHGVA